MDNNSSKQEPTVENSKTEAAMTEAAVRTILELRIWALVHVEPSFHATNVDSVSTTANQSGF